MLCKICHNHSRELFQKIILNKYTTSYHKCNVCGFIQTAEPTWLKEAYSNVITSTDIGLLNRNIYLVKEVKTVIDCCFPEAQHMLDYAGGYGVFVRLMRDEGFNFLRQDAYCENVFAKGFDITENTRVHFDIVTAFEVLEHFENPLLEIEKILAYADTAIFSTVLAPENENELPSWWYLATETGQHIAFYSKEALEHIATKFNKKYYCRNNNLHVFTSKQLNKKQVDYAFANNTHNSYLLGFVKTKKDFSIKRKSLLENDYENIKRRLNAN